MVHPSLLHAEVMADLTQSWHYAPLLAARAALAVRKRRALTASERRRLTIAHRELCRVIRNAARRWKREVVAFRSGAA